ncbi:ABC transporter substrate-binding protein [Intrasporangium calvum]|uniref:Extracellular solute-binding protein family 5 n=1 Tax=Intrasporangium calvum (strain ATCC 23552 / DSM 43043 / JCM 3097 / NBRC 12989 / NCIMB 10167 / NRRL B-3866 / 7 KIP) TaxID=710696 RepID=E6S8V9_INTC7|nr:ABC transporter substrate-binding protein [Intrasporangium calvum]ADU48096.1 extracellular solute-binding protein family 5 [Intrasporangium calvum DSM 43043]AXG13171.1 ABC transporter substrate-binding protein [Intrasporangium calvum]
MRWTTVLTAAGAAVSIGLVAACGAPTPTEQTDVVQFDKSSIATATSGMLPDATGPAPDVQGAKRGGVLTVPYFSTPANFDPSDQYFNDTLAILGLTHRALTAYAVRDGQSVLVPDLATDLGQVSEDGLTWTFTLKDGITYEDGSPVTAHDVVFALKRSFDKDLAQNAPTYQREFFKGGTTYEGPYQGDPKWKGVEARNDKTLVIRLEKRFESLPYFAAYPQFSPIPQAKDKKQDYTLHPLATGPYKFKTYTPGSELVLDRNPEWKPATDPARNDYLDGYHFKFGVEDVKAQTAILASNGVDATSLNWSPIDSSLVEQIEGPKKSQFVEGPSSCVYTLNLDTRKIPLEVRKAIAVAYPYDSVRKAGGQSTHAYLPGTTFIPPQVPGWVDYQGVDGFDGTGDGNAEKARKMLADLGYGPTRPFELSYYYENDSAVAERVNQVRKQKLELAGFRVVDKGVPAKERRQLAGTIDAPVNMLQSPAGWCYDWPSADSIFPPMVSSVAVSQGATSWGNISEEKIDQEIRRIQELPIADQGPEWGTFDKWLFESYLPAIPYQYSKGNAVFGAKVRNVVNDPHHGLPIMTQIWMEP